jgi:hypothetical protein
LGHIAKGWHLEDKVPALVDEFLLHLSPEGVESRVSGSLDALISFSVSIPLSSRDFPVAG